MDIQSTITNISKGNVESSTGLLKLSSEIQLVYLVDSSSRFSSGKTAGDLNCGATKYATIQKDERRTLIQGARTIRGITQTRYSRASKAFSIKDRFSDKAWTFLSPVSSLHGKDFKNCNSAFNFSSPRYIENAHIT